ncbi:MAG: ABC transporter substrate-binding protein [Chloroflexi bacterium]|nr:ABC transporter substrate-binding protein [Chloroflexota bacterium]
MKLKSMVIAGLILIVALSLAFACAKPQPAPSPSKVVKIGQSGPLSGPGAAWITPSLRGTEIWAAKVNAAGGLNIGGERYKVELVTYDDKAQGAEALAVARKMILEDKVTAIISFGGPTDPATGPFHNEMKVPRLSWDTVSFSPNYPYLVALNQIYPELYGLVGSYMTKANSGIKRVAFTSQDDGFGWGSRVFTLAGWESAGAEIVYDKFYPLEIADFAPVVSAILATKPDVIDVGASYAPFKISIFEQAYLQGYKGKGASSSWFIPDLLQKVPASFMEGGVALYADIGGPGGQLGGKEWKDEYERRWAGEYVTDAMLYRESAMIWAWAMEQAGTTNPEKAFAFLKSQSGVPTSWGPADWIGKEIYGVDNVLFPRQSYIVEIKNGVMTNVPAGSFTDWYKKNNAILAKYAKAAGQLWVGTQK